MRITDIRVYPVWVGHRNQCLVKVETDAGIYGWGESGLSTLRPARPFTVPVLSPWSDPCFRRVQGADPSPDVIPDS